MLPLFLSLSLSRYFTSRPVLEKAEASKNSQSFDAGLLAWIFSSPEAALLLVSTKNRDLWPPQRSNECVCLSRRARVGMDCTFP